MKKSQYKSDRILRLAKKQVKGLIRLIKLPEAELNLSDYQIHELRVSIKKIRALIQLYRPTTSKEYISHMDRSVKKIADSYANQRDNTVQTELLSKLLQDDPDQQQQNLQACLTSSLTSSTNSESPQSDVMQALLQCKKWLSDNALDTDNGLSYSYNKTRKLAKKAIKTGDDEIYHQCRKWLKYHLYQLQLIDCSPKKSLKQKQKKLAKLGSLLGEFHDYCVLENNLNILLKPDDPLTPKLVITETLTTLNQYKQRYKNKCRSLLQQFFSDSNLPA
jgi:CHAD domain-containing protein